MTQSLTTVLARGGLDSSWTCAKTAILFRDYLRIFHKKQKPKNNFDTCLHPEKRDAGQQVDGRLEVHQFFLAGRREVVPVHGQVYPERVVQLVEQLDEFLFLRTAGKREKKKHKIKHDNINNGSPSTTPSRKIRLTPKFEAAKRSLALTAELDVVCA